MILVVGARGALGSVVVARLARRGKQVLAASRDPSGLDVPPGVGTVRLDVRDVDSIAAALDHVDTVVAAFHGVAPPTRDNHPGIVDGTGTKALIDEAAAAGVEHFVLVSARGAAEDAPSRFLRLKHAAEEHLRASGMGWTIVRPAAFMEVHALALMGEPLRAGKPVRFVGAADRPIDWVSTHDVAEVIASSLDDPIRLGHVVEVIGAERNSRVGALEVLEEAVGVQGKRSHMPRGVAAVVQRLGGVANPGLGYLLEAALSEDAPPGHPTPADATVTGRIRLQEVAEEWAST